MSNLQASLRRGLESPSSAAIYKDALEAQTYRDFLDHLYDRFGRPVLIVSRNRRRGGLSSFFPRERQGRPEGFFEYLLAISGEARAHSPLELIELEQAKQLMENELKGPRLEFEWRAFLQGVYDLYVPIRPLKKDGEPAATFLIFGKYYDLEEQGKYSLNAWIDGLVGGSEPSMLPQVRPDTRRRQVQRLRQLAEGLPILTENIKRSVESEIPRAVHLLENFLGRINQVSRYLREDSLVDQLIIEEPTLDITEPKLWEGLNGVLRRLVQVMDLTTSAIYFADSRDYTYLKRVASFSRGGEPRDALQFPSIDAFASIAEKRWLRLPAAGDFGWLHAQSFLGTGYAILFGRELSMSHLVVVAIGLTRQQKLDPAAMASLWELVNTKVFPHIERAFAAIDLDQLLGEAGHLLGRSVGTVKSAAISLKEILHEIAPAGQLGVHDREFKVADLALEAGVMKLEVIRQNFYQIAHSHASAETEADGSEELETVDLLAIVDDLKKLFDTDADREGRLVKYLRDADSALVQVQKDAVKTVILNLWDNAVKFSYNKTTITIRVAVRGASVIFSIEDVGLGVPEDERRAIFRPRFKSRWIDEKSSKQKQGLGLGLAYCRRKIERDFKGVIELHSKPEKSRLGERFEGDAWTTTVMVTLPLAAS
jgi:signal transduction histidine kinase